jgi:hypothetical protein
MTETIGRVRLVRPAAVGVVVVALAAAVPATSIAAATPKNCPPASVVSAALGTKASTPTLTKNPYGISCKYGSNALAPKVEFQQDTTSTFAAGEKAANAALPVTKIAHLGQAAWAPKSGGSIYVFTGSYQVKILAVLTSLPRLEALARKLL